MTSAMSDPLKCTFEDAASNHLRDGMRLSVEAKIAWFEDMIEIAYASGALQRHDRVAEQAL